MNPRMIVLVLAAGASPLSAEQLSFDAVQPDPAAVRIMDIYARCPVAHDPERAAEILAHNYRTEAYKIAIQAFAMRERSCVPRAGKLKFQPIVFAGNPIILARGADKEDFPALRLLNLLERAQALVAARLALAF